MRKIFKTFILLLILFFISLFIVLSTIGIETDKFNKLITNKIQKTNNKVDLKLESIKFKIDFKELSLFLETIYPQINYRKSHLPAKNIKVYIDFFSLLKNEIKIKKINLVLEQLNINQFKKIIVALKPSNFTSFINSNINDGKINTELQIYFNNKNQLSNFIAKGSVSNLDLTIQKGINFKKTNFNFFGDKTDILIKEFNSETKTIKILDGDIKLNLSEEISLISNFKTKIKYQSESSELLKLIREFKFSENIKSFEAETNNTFEIKLDKTYQIKNFNYKAKGRLSKANLEIKKNSLNFFLKDQINKLSLEGTDINAELSPDKTALNLSGRYSLNKGNFLNFKLKNLKNRESINLEVDTEYDRPVNLELINYQKPEGRISKILLILKKKKNNLKIDTFNYSEGENLILAEGVEFDQGNLSNLKEISVKTKNRNKINNNFLISYGKKILIDGSQFDASVLPKIFKKKSSNNFFSKINKNIEINFSNIIAPLSENLKNFKLIGTVEKGKFIKVISKGDFGNNKFLDIKMTKNKKNKKKYLEVYSDLSKPLLTEYKFFQGLTGGKLFFTSTIDGQISNSNLKIEDFKVINAPGMVKLLSLADLGGLADLAAGEGLSFDILKISTQQSDNNLKFDEILALGPSVSVLMEGYQNPSMTSIKGTLVPAKTLNSLISKIPVLGKIIIPKEAGEGLFGVSFKMKGPPGKVKTTINPIRTLTPRFIQKILDKEKKFK